jgi:hypothetical protein
VELQVSRNILRLRGTNGLFTIFYLLISLFKLFSSHFPL